jgi:hypothetical protein
MSRLSPLTGASRYGLNVEFNNPYFGMQPQNLRFLFPPSSLEDLGDDAAGLVVAKGLLATVLDVDQFLRVDR